MLNIITMSSSPNSLKNFQRQFGDYLRNQTSSRFGNSPQRATTIYQELIFNNVKGFLDKCFPICQSIIGEDQWLALCQKFFKEYHLSSPYFIEINQSFVDFLSQQTLSLLNLPPFFAELAHYEWVELYVDTCTDHTQNFSSQDMTTQGHLILAPSVQNLHYHWPVHCISVDNLDTPPKDTYLLVFRDKNHRVSFIELGVLSHALLAFLQETPCKNPSELLDKFLDAIQQNHNEELRQATASTLQGFLQQHIIINN